MKLLKKITSFLTGEYLTLHALQAADHSYVVIGTREDLSDLISNISPTDTPFVNMCRKGSADSTKVEWQMDSLAAAAANARIEGDVAVAAAFSPTVRALNYTQISSKTVTTSGTVEATTKAGRGKSELAYQITKKTKELKRDVEYALLNQDVYVVGNTTTARQTMGLPGWVDGGCAVGATTAAASLAKAAATTGIVTTSTSGANQTSYSLNTARTASSTGTAVVGEDMVLAALQNVYINGGDPDTILTDPKTRATVSGWTSGTTKFTEAVDKKLVATVSIYESDYGVLKIVADRFMPIGASAKALFLLDSSGFELAYLRPYFVKDLAETGDFKNKSITVEFALKVDNNSSHGAVKDIL